MFLFLLSLSLALTSSTPTSLQICSSLTDASARALCHSLLLQHTTTNPTKRETTSSPASPSSPSSPASPSSPSAQSPSSQPASDDTASQGPASNPWPDYPFVAAPASGPASGPSPDLAPGAVAAAFAGFIFDEASGDWLQDLEAPATARSYDTIAASDLYDVDASAWQDDDDDAGQFDIVERARVSDVEDAVISLQFAMAALGRARIGIGNLLEAVGVSDGSDFVATGVLGSEREVSVMVDGEAVHVQGLKRVEAAVHRLALILESLRRADDRTVFDGEDSAEATGFGTDLQEAFRDAVAGVAVGETDREVIKQVDNDWSDAAWKALPVTKDEAASRFDKDEVRGAVNAILNLLYDAQARVESIVRARESLLDRFSETPDGADGHTADWRKWADGRDEEGSALLVSDPAEADPRSLLLSLRHLRAELRELRDSYEDIDGANDFIKAEGSFEDVTLSD
uniref:Uncharacterized protein n=1 Tax=Sexangularia sp. CB-2014 TaxID=1486929 RepID=A0A7S1VGT7_9EUKA